MILLAQRVVATDVDTVINTLSCSSTGVMYSFFVMGKVGELEIKIVCNASDTGEVCVCVCVCACIINCVHVYIRYTITLTHHSTQSIQRWALLITPLYNHHYRLTNYLKVPNVSYMVVPSAVMIQLTG